MKSSRLFYDFFRPFALLSVDMGYAAQVDMALVLETPLRPQLAALAGYREYESERATGYRGRLHVYCVQRSRPSEKPVFLHRSSSARITLVVPQIVPYPLPLAEPARPARVERERVSHDRK